MIHPTRGLLNGLRRFAYVALLPSLSAGAVVEQVAILPAPALDNPKATGRVDPMKGVYAAEAYHQDFLLKHPTQPYIVVNDLPKVRNFQRTFPDWYQGKAVTSLQQAKN
jgi:hypothetical protein